jgi:hypothetical protein
VLSFVDHSQMPSKVLCCISSENWPCGTKGTFVRGTLWRPFRPASILRSQKVGHLKISCDPSISENITQLSIFSHENLVCENSPEDGYHIRHPTDRKSFALILQSSYLRCWINIPSCSSNELQSVTSHESVTLLNPNRYLHAGVRKWFQGSSREFRSRKSWWLCFPQHGS